MKIRFLFIAAILFAGIMTSPIFAQSLFSGLVLSERNNGLMVVEVQKESPVFDAGLRKGDILLEVEGKKINNLESYVELSRTIKNEEKVEAYLTILREGVKYEAVIKVYSIPVYQSWNEKVAKPADAPHNLKGTPFEYWVDRGKRTLAKVEREGTIQTKVKRYHEAITYFYNGLHYQPDSIDTALQIASTYRAIGKLYLDNGSKEESIRNYKNSFRLYAYCFKKTEKEDSLKLILLNLKKIEKELGQINSGTINSP